MSRILFIFLLSISFSFSQDYFIVNDGVKTKEHQYEAFTNGKIHTKSGIINSGTLLIKDGEVISVGTNINIPENTIIHNLNGSYVYPSFVELNSSFGIKKYLEQALVEVLNMNLHELDIIGMIIYLVIIAV